MSKETVCEALSSWEKEPKNEQINLKSIGYHKGIKGEWP